MTNHLSEVRRQIVPDSRPSCTEGSVAEVGPRPTGEKRTSVSRAQSSMADVASLSRQVSVSQAARSVFSENTVEI